MKHRYGLLALLLLAAVLLTACASKADETPAEAETTGLTIDAASLGTDPSFIDWKQGDTDMQLIALKDGKGGVRLAFNTCQSCGGSPYAWFDDLGDGTLQCQNCGLLFPLDTVGSDAARGCNPVAITDYTVNGDTVNVPETVLAANAARFANWKKFD